MRPAPPIPTKDVHTITPEMTPSPTLKPVLAKKDGDISPVSPLPPPSERRPFSYEPVAAAARQRRFESDCRCDGGQSFHLQLDDAAGRNRRLFRQKTS